MARRTQYNGQGKTIAAGVAQTLTWTASEVQSERVVAHHLILQGAGNDLTIINRVRVFAQGSTIITLTPAQLRAYWQGFAVGAAVKYAATAQVVTIPYLLPDAPDPLSQDVSQFPTRSNITIEVELSAAAAAGQALMAWTETDVAPVVYPRLLASQMNIPASVTQARYAFQENGVVRALIVPNVGISRARIVLGGQEWTQLPGPQFSGLANLGNALLEAEVLYGNGVASSGTPLTSPQVVRLTGGVSAPVNQSFLELDTGAAWAGVANELVTCAIAPQAAA